MKYFNIFVALHKGDVKIHFTGIVLIFSKKKYVL